MCKVFVGRLVLSGPIHGWTCLTGWTGLGSTTLSETTDLWVYTSKSDAALVWLVSAMRKEVDYLPMAKPDAINY